MSNKPVRILRAGIRGEASNREAVVRICYKPEDQEKEVDEPLLNQPEQVTWSQVLTFLGDFNHSSSNVSGGVT